MAIFQTGAVTTIPNLADTIAQFALANGWTVNMNQVEGSGRRVHLQKGDVFINLRALVNEQVYAAGGAGAFTAYLYGLVMNGSTGYDDSLSWALQPGHAKWIQAPYGYDYPRLNGMVGIAGAMPAYYLFARGNMIYCWLEYATGQYQWLVFGKITKTSTWTGGTLFAASNLGTDNGINNWSGIANMVQSNSAACGYHPYSYLYAENIDGNTGWCSSYNEQMTPPMPKFFDTIANMGCGAGNLSNTFNTQPVLVPIEIAICRDGAGDRGDYTNWSIEGYLPDMYFCNLRTLIPAQQIDDGSGDVFRVFPFRQKGNDGNSGTGWWGVAIKEN